MEARLKILQIMPQRVCEKTQTKNYRAPRMLGTMILNCCRRSRCVVPGLLVLLEHPLSLTVSGTRLHLHHYLIEVDEIGRAGRGATFLVRLFHLIAELEASSDLHAVHKLPQAFVRGSL